MKIVKSVLSSIWEFFCIIGRAKYAAELARNHKWEQAQAMYKSQ